LFVELDQERFASNEGRRAHKNDLHKGIEAITQKHVAEKVAKALAAAGIPHAPITPVEGVMNLPFVESTALRTVAPNGKTVRLPPPAVITPHLEKNNNELPFSPSYGEQTDTVLAEAGVAKEKIISLRERGVVA
ncbi:MAG: CoA transferase, partial [Pseudomonadota bacterium]